MRRHESRNQPRRGGRGFYYAPDPSSQIACTIGGNVAENSGGVHCLKYGLTTNNVLGVELVTPQGEVVRIGGQHLDSGHYDLLGSIVGSEGLLGIVTEVTVRILRRPQTARALLIGFAAVEPAAACVAAVIAAGIIPAGMEMMDRPAIHAAEAFVNVGYPLDVEALLIVELDGPQVEVDYLHRARERDRGGATRARGVRASDERARAARVLGRPQGRVPGRRALEPRLLLHGRHDSAARAAARALRDRRDVSNATGLRVANVFHAGDGNLHPLILYDANVPGEIETAEAFGGEILKLCVDVGGVLTGEHGVGLEKRDLMTYQFDATDLEVQHRVKHAFDPDVRFNPGKVFPTLRRCAERGREHVHAGADRFARVAALC